jgi:D-sedoheptulose 7-phosphate isomerase
VQAGVTVGALLSVRAGLVGCHVTQREREALTLPVRTALPDLDCRDAIAAALAGRRATLDASLAQLAARCGTLAGVAALLVETLRAGRKVLVAGNGGSAAEAQHFAAELVGRFRRERAPYAVLSLTTDTSILTAIANDYAYEDVFGRQVFALGRPGDLLLAFSTSGESENLLRAAMAARQQQLVVVALTGARPSRLGRLADLTVRVPVADPAEAQELHKIITHILCDLVESELAAGEDGFGP